VHRLDSVESYLSVLDGHSQVSAPGERFAYNNGGYVVLALLAERATGVPLAELVRARVCEPAGLTATSFERSDALPGDVAVGYLHDDGLRTNVLHLPVLGGGDGGLSTTVADVHALWHALLAGRIVTPAMVTEMMLPRGATASGRYQHGYGLWLPAGGDRIEMEGQDAGISFRSSHAPGRGVTYTVASNTTYGAWPICELLDEFGGDAPAG
jgi:CubicO group peptidase (beta-lactamase class C family)